MTAAVVLIVGLVLASSLVVAGSRGLHEPGRMALAVVLGVSAATFNIVVPVASVEATTTIVICSAAVLGAPFAVAVGSVAVLGSSAAAGFGVWTLWQLVGIASVALVGVLGSRRGPSSARVPARALLAFLAAAGAVVYDVLVTIPSMLFINPAADSGITVLATLLLGAPFTLVHLVTAAALTWLGGPSLMHALGRARLRLDAEVDDHIVEAVTQRTRI